MLTPSLFLLLILANVGKAKFIRFVERCPTRIERQKLSLYSECASPEEYHCARDDDLILAEICNEVIQLPPGNYPRYTSYTDRIFYDICPDNRHQPWPVKSNEIADCEVEKSTCNGVGQLLCDHGTVTDDVTCRCDFTNGFVFRGSSTCCSPSGTEDCYCEYRPCQNASQELNADYKCVDRCRDGYERKKGEEICRIIEVTNSSESTTQIISTGQGIVIVLVKEPIAVKVAISVVTVFIVCLLIVAFHVLLNHDIRPENCLDVYPLLYAVTNSSESTTQIISTGQGIVIVLVKEPIAVKVAISVVTVFIVCLLIVAFHVLLNHDIRPENCLDVYPLLYAVAKGNLAVIKRYFDEKFDMNLSGYDGRTALHVAVSANQASIVEYLIKECNVDINLHDRSGRTAHDEAVMKGKQDLLILFGIRDKDLADTFSREWKTFRLLRAGSVGDTKMLKKFHKDGYDMEMRDYDGQTALHLASAYGHLEAVKFLIDICKVETKIPDRDGRTPYHEAEANKKCNKNNSNYDSILAILRATKKSADIMVNDQSDDENIIYKVNDAAAKGNVAKLKSLVWVHIDTGDYLKETPLHVAAAKGQLELVKYLVEEKKVSLFVRNSFWETPIRLARKKCKYWKKKLRIAGISLQNKEKRQSKWEDYGKDLQSDSDSDTEDKDIHDRIQVFRDVSKYLCKKMREQIDDETVVFGNNKNK